MTIIARVTSLQEAYRGVQLLRSRSIPPQLLKDGNDLMLGVEDDFAMDARKALKESMHAACLPESTMVPGYCMSYEYMNT
jgi:hypothetical protein